MFSRPAAFAFVWVLALSASSSAPAFAQPRPQPAPAIRFEITVPAAIRPEPVTGRVYIMITRNGEREPRLQPHQVDGIPFIGRDVGKLAPGAAAAIDQGDPGFPVATLRDIPDGDDVVQAFVNVCSAFRRADGHIVWMHVDQWEVQPWHVAPGRLSQTERVKEIAPFVVRKESRAASAAKARTTGRIRTEPGTEQIVVARKASRVSGKGTDNWANPNRAWH